MNPARLLAPAALLLAAAGTAAAEPVVSAVAGSAAHGAVLTVSGSGFGLKSPAAPLLWDDGTTAPPLGSRYDGWLPTAAQQGSQYNMAYREAGFRGVAPPHGRISYVLGGAHATSDLGDTYAGGGNVALGKNLTSHSYFISYYYRVDPAFDEENHPTLADNMKEIVLSNTPGAFYPDGWGAFGYANWCNDPGKDVPDRNYTGSVVLARIPIDPANMNLPYACSGTNLVYHTSPVTGWIKMEWEGVYNRQFDAPQLLLTTYPDGQRAALDHYGDGLTTYEYARGPWSGYPKEADLRFVGIGGFARVPRENNGVNSFRYFAGVYLDDTHARVVLGDRPDYNACTVVEPQIPRTWSDGAIEVVLNLGALPDEGTAYLFVFDAADARSAQGFPVELGAPGPDETPPAPPRQFRLAP